jgi:hypothetical protein
MQYTIQKWCTPIGEFRSFLFELTYRRELGLRTELLARPAGRAAETWSQSGDRNF